MITKLRIFVIDDEPEMGNMLSDFLTSQGYEVSKFTSAQEAFQNLTEDVRLVITDLRMPGMDGFSFIENTKRKFPELPIILITAFGSIENAIEATRKGAYHFLTKPLKLAELQVYVEKALHFHDLQRHNQMLRQEYRTRASFAGIIGKSAAMQAIFDLIQRVAPTATNILIQGDSGTGKELVARAIHNLGPRKDHPFVAINCTAIPDTLLESELFGHAKGSFTGAVQRKKGLFEEADGGTIFLDEIGDMDMPLQAKILRVIQERRIRAVGDNTDKAIDVRIIAATHKDLKAAIRDGRFREDLYYRLSVIPMVIPPLRHRVEDIPLLAQFFLDRYNSINGKHIRGFDSHAVQTLMSLPWEGNVRELENVIERAVVLCRGELITDQDLPQPEKLNSEALYAQMSEELPTLEDFERRYIKFILDKTGGKKEKAAQILGINRRTLYRKEREYGWVEADPQEDQENLN
ncbi:MAG: sigma-54-dependent transcriptional regulator [Bdellovibrionia bacterium]